MLQRNCRPTQKLKLWMTICFVTRLILGKHYRLKSLRVFKYCRLGICSLINYRAIYSLEMETYRKIKTNVLKTSKPKVGIRTQIKGNILYNMYCDFRSYSFKQDVRCFKEYQINAFINKEAKKSLGKMKSRIS